MAETAKTIEDLAKQTFTKGDTTFRIRKMLAMEAYEVLEIIRPGVKGALSKVSGGFEDVVTSVVFGLDREIVEQCRQRMFACITFTRPNSPDPRTLATREDEGFAGMEAHAVYETLVRAFAVNFTPSFSVLMQFLESHQAEKDTP